MLQFQLNSWQSFSSNLEILSWVLYIRNKYVMTRDKSNNNFTIKPSPHLHLDNGEGVRRAQHPRHHPLPHHPTPEDERSAERPRPAALHRGAVFVHAGVVAAVLQVGALVALESVAHQGQ